MKTLKILTITFLMTVLVCWGSADAELMFYKGEGVATETCPENDYMMGVSVWQVWVYDPSAGLSTVDFIAASETFGVPASDIYTVYRTESFWEAETPVVSVEIGDLYMPDAEIGQSVRMRYSLWDEIEGYHDWVAYGQITYIGVTNPIAKDLIETAITDWGLADQFGQDTYEQLTSLYQSQSGGTVGGLDWVYYAEDPAWVTESLEIGDYWTDGHGAYYIKLGSGEGIPPTISGVPEPATVVGLAIAALGVAARRMRKQVRVPISE